MNVGSSRFARLLVAGFAAGALAAPAASARPAPPEASTIPGDASTQVAAEFDAPIVRSVDEGFDWASAALGAGGAGGLVLVLLAGGFGYRAHHENVRIAR
jgi:hypothetical protein